MEQFEKYLKKCNLSQKTINSYIFSIKTYFAEYNTISKRNLNAFKLKLIEDFNPKTVNIKILAINKYLKFIKKDDLCLKMIKLQQKNFLDNVISEADYNYLKNQLKRDEEWDWYFVVRYLCATGARVSELIEIKIEHVQKGYYDIYSKGGKVRRLYIPIKLKKETMEWVNNRAENTTGFLFLNRYKNKITTRGIALQLKSFARKYGIRENVVYPHSFRHRFAKNFLAKYNDIALLADLMGHESIETTRIYLRKTATEQQTLVNKIVTW